MRKMTALICILFVACTVGNESEPEQQDPVTYVDSDGDGVTDGIDTDGDGDADERFGSPQGGLPTGGVPVCTWPLVDTDNNGTWDGLDSDCDGDIDIPFYPAGGGGGGGGGGTNQCNVTIQNNNEKRQVTCENGSCECRENDVLTKTCTETTAGCSFPGNCCGF